MAVLPTFNDWRRLLRSSSAAVRLEAAAAMPRPLAWLAYPPLMLEASNLAPDPWQERALLSESPRILMLCTRQAGKSTVAAALALREALSRDGALVLLLSPTLRQSGELFRDKVLPLWRRMGSPGRLRAPTALELVLRGGSRVVSLPETESGIRGFSAVSLLVVDEASRVDDAVYFAVRPMLAVSGGKLVLLSTPFGRRGFFFEEWENGGGVWERYAVPARECPRISPAFLTDERRALGERWYRQEYELSFEAAQGQVFAQELIDRAASPEVKPLFG